MKIIGHFINGREVASQSNRLTDIFNPATGEVHSRVSLGLASELDDAGIIEITYSGSHKNSAYYNNTTSAPVYNSGAGTVVITKSKTARDLTTLKASKTSEIENSANASMASTDWYVTRKSEK